MGGDVRKASPGAAIGFSGANQPGGSAPRSWGPHARRSLWCSTQRPRLRAAGGAGGGGAGLSRLR